MSTKYGCSVPIDSKHLYSMQDVRKAKYMLVIAIMDAVHNVVHSIFSGIVTSGHGTLNSWWPTQKCPNRWRN